MHFERLTTDTDPRYPEAMALYQISFPLHEQRAEASQRAILSHTDYRFNLIMEGTSMVGILLCWETPAFFYVEHFCIRPALRGQRYGQRALELLHQQGKPVLLEIDPPVDAVSIRRKGFYERAGYQVNAFPHIHPPYHPEFSGHSLVMMSYPKPLTQDEYDTFFHYLKHTVMGL